MNPKNPKETLGKILDVFFFASCRDKACLKQLAAWSLAHCMRWGSLIWLMRRTDKEEMVIDKEQREKRFLLFDGRHNDIEAFLGGGSSRNQMDWAMWPQGPVFSHRSQDKPWLEVNRLCPSSVTLPRSLKCVFHRKKRHHVCTHRISTRSVSLTAYVDLF